MKFLKILKHNAKSIRVLAVIGLCTSIWAFILQSDAHLPPNLSSDFWNSLSFSWAHWDKWITVLTFVIAAVIGWQGYTRRWENSLPNKITVHFMFDGNCIMSCYRAYLSGEDDIRNWAQQIGRQMTGSNLSMEPVITQKPEEIIDNPGFKHYETTLFLYEEPSIFKGENLKNKYLTWVVEDDSVSKRTHARGKHPLAFEQAKTTGEKFIENDSTDNVDRQNPPKAITKKYRSFPN